MSQVVTPLGAAGSSPGLLCLTGTIRRAEPIGIIQRGTHRLVDLSGNVTAALRSNQVNLFALEGRLVTVCGINEGVIEGVTSLLVTQVQPAFVPGITPLPQIDLRLLIVLLLLAQAGLLRGIRPELLLVLLLGTGPFGFLGSGTISAGAL